MPLSTASDPTTPPRCRHPVGVQHPPPQLVSIDNHILSIKPMASSLAAQSMPARSRQPSDLPMIPSRPPAPATQAQPAQPSVPPSATIRAPTTSSQPPQPRPVERTAYHALPSSAPRATIQPSSRPTVPELSPVPLKPSTLRAEMEAAELRLEQHSFRRTIQHTIHCCTFCLDATHRGKPSW